MYRFYREELPEKEKILYDLLLTSFERLEIEIKVPLLGEEKIKQIFKYVLYDNPLIFYVEGLITKKKFLSNCISLYPKYNYSKEELEYAESFKNTYDIMTESICKLIQQRYGYNYQLLNCKDDINYYDDSDFSIYGLSALDLDKKLRIIFKLNNQNSKI